MPTAKDFKTLTMARKRDYRAIWTLYKDTKSSPSIPEICELAGTAPGNFYQNLLWLETHGWVSRKPKQHRSIVPLVKLTKKEMNQ
jgi:DNA-binding MarR family transcriptional regulator